MVRGLFGRFLFNVFWVVVASYSMGCSFNANIDNLASKEGAIFQQKVLFEITELDISEGSASIVSVQLSDKMSTDTVIGLSVLGNSDLIQPLPISVTIPAGSLTVPLKINTIDDLVFIGSQTLKIVLTPENSALVAEPNTLKLNISDNDLPTLTFSSSAQSVTEYVVTASVLVQIEGVSNKSVTVPVVFSGTATEGSAADYVASSALLTIPAGTTQATLSFTIFHDSISETNETIIATLGTPTNAILGAPIVHTVTITDADLGSFNITGVTGPGDLTADASLNNGLVPTINWGASDGATSYDVTVYASDGSTEVCATVNTAGTSYNFSACTLTGGLDYKVKINSKKTGVTRPADNNMYSFRANRNPVANNDGPTRVMKNSGSITLQVVTATDTSTRGTIADSDPDSGDTISITGVTSGSSGGVVTFTASSVTYTVPNASFTGVETFTYTLSDNHGATATGTVTIHVMSTYTWTGKVSTNWTTNGNWCGTIANNTCLGTTGFPNSAATATHLAVFDGTCTAVGHQCTATINSAISAYQISLNSGFSTGSLTQTSGAGNSITIGAGGFTSSSGTFTGSNAAISVAGPVSITGGLFQSTSATLLTTSGNFTISSPSYFVHNSGTIQFGGSSKTRTLTANNVDFFTLVFAGWSDEVTATAPINVRGNLSFADTYDSSAALVGSTTINLYGNLTTSSNGCGGSNNIKLVGNVDQTVTASVTSARIPAVEVASTGGTVYFVGTIPIRGNFIHTSGNIDFGTSTIYFINAGMGGTRTIVAPGITFNHLTIWGYGDTTNVSGAFNIAGNFSFGDSTTAAINGSSITALGNVQVTGVGVGGSGTIIIGGSVNQTLSSSGGSIPNLNFASTAGVVTVSGSIKIFGSLSRSSGVVDFGTSTVIINSYSGQSHNISGTGLNFYNLNLNYFNQTTTIGSDISVLGTLTLGDTYQTNAINGATISAFGPVNNWGYGHSGTTQIAMKGSSNATLGCSAGAKFPGNQVSVLKDPTIKVTLTSNCSLSTVGQDLVIQSGELDLAGFSLNVNDFLQTDAGAVFTANGGAYTPNSPPKFVCNGTCNP